jgi:hypothetical protein
MARQRELPNTRRDDETPSQPQDDKMDELTEAICKSKRRRKRANQDVTTSIKSALGRMKEIGAKEWQYLDDGIKRKLVIDDKLKDVQEKIVKRRPDDEEDEE